jgi:arsenite methyltransferase
MESNNSVQDEVKEKYGNAARAVSESGSVPACCDSGLRCCDPITANLYRADQTEAIPEKAVRASLRCGNPTSLIDLRLGETVLDLGSGGGIDVLLSAKRVGPTGKAYGLDMTDDMLALARENQRQARATNVEFLKGEIERIPLPDSSVDVIISNCVINLSADKDRVLREAFRVLRPGGRFAISDVVVRGSVPDEVRRSMLLWVGCIAGALEENEYIAKLKAAGFEDVSIEPTRVYNVEDARSFLTEAGVDVDAVAPQVNEKFFSAFVRANKPKASCCHPDCCTPALAGERNSNHGGKIQRSIPLYRELCALDHGRGHPESQRQGQVHGLQRGQSSDRTAAAGGASADCICWTLSLRPSQQVMGRVLRTGCAEARLRLYRLRQRCEGAVSLLAGATDDRSLGCW